MVRVTLSHASRDHTAMHWTCFSRILSAFFLFHNSIWFVSLEMSQCLHFNLPLFWSLWPQLGTADEKNDLICICVLLNPGSALEDMSSLHAPQISRQQLCCDSVCV